MNGRGKFGGKVQEQYGSHSSLLLYDSVRSYTHKNILSSFKQHYKTTVAVMPGEMTPLFAASWRPLEQAFFKAAMRHRWNKWLAEGEAEFTASGKSRHGLMNHGKSYLLISLIKKSFVECGSALEGDSDFNILHSKLKRQLRAEERASVDEPSTSGEPSGMTDRFRRNRRRLILW